MTSLEYFFDFALRECRKCIYVARKSKYYRSKLRNELDMDLPFENTKKDDF